MSQDSKNKGLFDQFQRNSNSERNLVQNAGINISSTNVLENPALTEQVNPRLHSLLGDTGVSGGCDDPLGLNAPSGSSTTKPETPENDEFKELNFPKDEDNAINTEVGEFQKVEIDEEKTKQSPNADSLSQGLMVCFHLHVHKNALGVTLLFETETNLPIQEYPLNCKHQNGSHSYWNVHVPVLENVSNVKYKYMVQYQGKKSKWEKKYLRTGLCGKQNHYDVFKEYEFSKKEKDRTFKGKFFFIKEHFGSLFDNGSNLSQVLEDIDNIGFGQNILGKEISNDSKKSFYSWVNEKINKDLTPHRSAVICSVLGQFFKDKLPDNFLKTILSKKEELADELLIQLSQCDKSHLTEKSMASIEHIHLEIVKASTRIRITNLYYVQMFGHLFPPDVVTRDADHYNNPDADKFDGIATTVIQNLVNLRDVTRKDIVIKYVISKVPTISSLRKVFRQLHENESYEPYEEIIIERFPDLIRKENDINLPLALWTEIPAVLRSKLAVTFLQILRQRLDTRGQQFGEQFISELILDEELQKGASKDLVEFLKFLSSFKLQKHNCTITIVCNVLKDKRFFSFWEKIKETDANEIVQNLALSTIELVFSLQPDKDSIEEYVVAIFLDLDNLSKIPALEKYESLIEKCIWTNLREYNFGKIVNAYDEMQKSEPLRTSKYVQKWFTTVTIEFLHVENPDATVKSKLLSYISTLSSSKDEEMNRKRRDILFLLLNKSPHLTPAPNPEDQLRSIVDAVLSDRQMWDIVFEEAKHDSRLSKHRTYLNVKSAMDKLAASFIDGHISLKCIMDVDDRKKFLDFLVLGRCAPEGINVPESEADLRREWVHILSELLTEISKIKEDFVLLDRAINLSIEITDGQQLELKDSKALSENYNRLNRTFDTTEFAGIRQEHYLGPLKSLLNHAEVCKLYDSILFKNFARHRLEEQTIQRPETTVSQSPNGEKDKYGATTKKWKKRKEKKKRTKKKVSVEKILMELKEGVEPFKFFLKRINDQGSNITSKELDKLFMDIEEHNIRKEFDSVAEALSLPCLSENVLKMLEDYVRFDVVKKNIQAAMECFGAVGYALHCISDEDNFLEVLNSFISCKESGTLNSISAYMNEPTIVKIQNQLSPELVETFIELSRASELIEFIIQTADDNMEDLVDAVEEYSEQQIQASTVSDLIDVHRFFSTLLSDKPKEPEMFLENVSKAYINITAEIPSSQTTGETVPRNKVNMAAKIKVVSCNVHSLRCLHMMLSNRQEVTKDIITNAVKKGRYQVWIKLDGSVGLQLTYEREHQDKTAKYNSDELNDLRSRALLLVNTKNMHKNASDCEKDSLDYQKDLTLFIDQVDTLTQIVRKYKVLKSSGIPDYDKYSWKTLNTTDEIRQEEVRVNKEAEKWDNMIERIRKQNFFLNYFHTKQLWLLKDFFNNNISSAKEVSDEVLVLVQYIDPKVTKDDLLLCHSEYVKSEMVENELCAIGEALKIILKSYFENLSPVKRSPLNKIDEVVQPSKVYIDVLEKDSVQTVNVIMALFQNTCGSLPKSSQLLFCSPRTTWDEIEILLLRTFDAQRHGFRSNLHCIANVECLSNDIQLKLIERLKVLVDNSDAPYLLAIVCRGENQPLQYQFPDHVRGYGGMPDAEMRKTFKLSCPDTLLVTGDLPGLGKSEEIHALAMEMENEIVTFPISGQFVPENLVKRLSKLKLKDFQSIHFDVGEIDDPVGLDTFLFELIVTKMVSTGALICSLSTSHVYIEVANTFQQRLKNSLPVCNCLKRLEVKWKDYRNLVVSSELTSPIQVVCHYLNAKDNGHLEQEEVVLSGPKKAEPLNPDKCQALLKTYFSPVGDLNFNILRSFLSVLANQLLQFSRNPYLKPKNLKDMAVQKHQDIRNDVFNALLEVSKTFAARPLNTCKRFQVEVEEGNITADQIDETQHLVIMLHTSGPITTIYRNREDVPQNVKELSRCQDVSEKGLEDYSKMSQDELQKKLERISDAPTNSNKGKLESLKYVLTPDNLLKMALIIQRIQAGIPVIIMGETGCGKTSLMRYLAQTCSIPFEVFSFHAGITEEQIIEFISFKDKEAKDLQREGKSLWVFLDEINTCDYLGTINEVVCHRSIQGRELASNLIFVATCNPYRLRPKGSIMTAGLTGKTSFDELSKLVYRVHPLPETMIDYVWDYGSLSEEDEKAYIGRMVERVFDNSEHELLVDLLATSQQFIRDEDNSSFCVSLRDVNRAIILMDWFYTALSNPTKSTVPKNCPVRLQEVFMTSKMILNTPKAIVLSLAHCYLSRLPTSDLRQKYCSKMTQLFIDHKKHEFRDNEEAFQRVVRAEQEDYLSRMELPEGTAKNAALRENVFVTLVCILNRIPVFVVGKPGCSKSLSMQIIRSNLRGRDSKDPFLKTLPKLLVVSFQGSESSTSEGIKKVFAKARKFKSEDVLPVVLLDEIGLAENSKFNPLKVLHHLLETDKGEFPDVAVVGISNWALDAAKMNRAIHLSRPEPDYLDLYETGRSISSDENSEAPEIECLAEAYNEYQKNQKHENFHGLRDYYSMVKCFDISHRLSDVSSETIQRAMQRNFGGTTVGKGDLQSAFYKKLKSVKPIGDVVEFHVTDLIADNLQDRMARHLMLIGDSAIEIFDHTMKYLNKEKIIMSGSSFEEDFSADYSHRILSRIILCMERNCILILRDLERIYGSLYDMLNQNYVLVGGKKICRIALGAFSNPMCQVDGGFRCIVLVDEKRVNYSDPPFLNRFEKQLLRFSDILNDTQRKIIKDLDKWVKAISSIKAKEGTFDKADMFAGFNDDTLQSLVLLHSRDSSRPNEKVLEKCKDDLMMTATPEAVIRIFKSSLHYLNKEEAKKMYADYFNMPINDGLKSFLTHKLKLHEESEHGSMKIFVMTHSGIQTDVSQCIGDPFVVQTDKLCFFKSEKDLSKRVKHFFLESKANLLIFQCRPETDAHNMQLLKITIEDHQNAFISSGENHENQKHVCIVMHLCRSIDAEEGRDRWQFSFLSGWTQVVIDCLEEPTIQIKELLKCSIVDLVTNEIVPFKKVAADQLDWCFNRIKYPLSKQPTLADISTLVKAVTSSKEIMDCFMTLCCRYIRNERVDSNSNWMIAVACDRQLLINSSTLAKAVEHFIIHLMRDPLSRIVYFVQKHSAFQSLVSDDVPSRQECLNLLSNESIFTIAEVPEPQGPESLVVDFSCADLRFPLSHVFCGRIDGLYDFFSIEYRRQCMKEENLDDNEELTDDARTILVKKMSLKVEQVFTEIIGSEILSQKIPFYVDDVLDMKTDAMSDSLSRNQRIGIMKAHYGTILPSAYSDVNDVAGVVAQLHCNFWLEGNDIPHVLYFIKDCMSIRFLCIDDLLSQYWNWELNVNTQRVEERVCAVPYEENLNQLLGKYVDINIRHKDEYDNRKAEENDEPTKQPQENDDGSKMSIQETQEDCSERASSSENTVDEQTCKGKDSRGDAFDCESESSENDMEEELEENGKPSFEDFLVENICSSFLPTQEFIVANGGINEWERAVNLVISSATGYCPPLPAYYYLKFCKDFAQKFDEPNSLYTLGELGREVSDGKFLDSPAMLKAVCNVLENLRIKGQDNTKLNEFLFLFCERCIQSNPDSEMNREILKKVPFCEKDHMLPLISSLLNIILVSAQDQMAFSLETLEQLITSLNLNDFPNLIELNAILSRLHDNEKALDSHINVVCCDLINRLAFKDLDIQKLSRSSSCDVEMKAFHKAMDVLTESDQNSKKNPFGFICAISYLRAFMSNLAKILSETPDTASLEPLLEALATHLEEDERLSRKSTVSKFLLKELGQLMCLHDVKQLIQKCKHLQFLMSLGWRDTQAAYKLRCNPFNREGASSKSALAINSYVASTNPEDLEKRLGFLKESCQERLQLATIMMERFYMVRSIRELNVQEKEEARSLTNIVTKVTTIADDTYNKFIARIACQDSFKCRHLKISSHTRTIDVQVAVLIQHLTAILTSSVTSKRTNPVMCCLINPEEIKKSYMVASPDNETGYKNYKLTITPLVHLFSCKCGTRFVGQPSANIKCPCCNCPCKEDERDDQEKPQAIQGYVKLNLESLTCDMLHTRNLDPVQFRLLHLIVHAALLAGFSIDVVSAEKLGDVMKDDNPPETCYEVIQVDIKVLCRLLCSKKENIVTLVHHVIENISALLTEDCPLPHNEQMRSSWENDFAEKVQPIIQRFSEGHLIEPAEDNHNTTMAALVYERHLPEFDDVTSRNLSVPRLFRLTQPNTLHKLRQAYLNSPKDVKEKYQLLGLFLDYHDKLHLISNLTALLSWSRHVDILLSRRLTRSDAKEKYIHDAVLRKEVSFQATSEDSTKNKEFEEFINAWRNVVPFMNELNIQQSDKMPYIAEGDKIGYCLTEEQDLGQFLCRCFVSLAEMQNDFLDKCLAIASNGKSSALHFLSKRDSVCRIPVIHVQDAKKKEIICYEWTDSFLDSSYRETEYGRGNIVRYDMEKVEKELAGYFLLGKAYLDSSNIREFVFSKQLFHDCANIINELCHSIPQEELPPTVKAEIEHQSMDRIQTLLGDLELVLCYLRRMKVKPNDSLVEHINILMSSSRPFPKDLPTTLNTTQIKHVCALYEFVEDRLADPSVESCGEDYRGKIRDGIINDLRESLQHVDKDELKAVTKAIKRFAFRYLHMKPNKGKCLLELMKDPSLWPMALRVQRDDINVKVPVLAHKFFPEELTIGQTYEVHRFFQELNKSPPKSRFREATPRPPVKRNNRKVRKSFS